ncbi:low density lipoprotein receptor adapter protein 1-B-like [Ostrea edulis]|uniref:low density lipoprotein receptor adapter protein 1-B-like n=1 Tax=Ostrea edulis TaxID=37623 RepID=UPI00209613AB|nr:low density lipoprotein receptor adapter protein 1-B-like [Ostrea edulis]
MWSATKVRARITETDPVFRARYIGFAETFVASGQGCTTGPVQKLWDNAGEERELKKMTIIINTSGITIKGSDKKKEQGRFYPIENISFCNADVTINERIFCWICKDSESPSLQCHAVICGSKEEAKSMALVMSRAFQIAYKEWKTLKNREERESKKIGTKGQAQSKQSSFRKDIASQPDSDSIHSSESGSVHESHSNGGRELFRRDSECQTDMNDLTNELNSSLKIMDSDLDTVSKSNNCNDIPTAPDVVTVSVGTEVQLAEQEVLY